MLNPKARPGLALLSALSLALAGCGGGGRSTAVPAPVRTAALRLKMVWPTVAPRMVPNAANSVVAIVTVNGTEVARSLFTRPIDNRSPIDAGSTTTLLSALPAGIAQVTYTAYPTVDGSGTAQAKGSATETLVAEQTTEDTASMASTVSELSLELGAPTMRAVEAMDTAVSAKDASGATVLLATRYAEKLTWSSSDPSIATVDGSGRISSVAVGTVEIQASMVVDDAGSKKSASATLIVSPILAKITSEDVDDSQHTMPVGGTAQMNLIATKVDGTTMDVTSEAVWSSSDPSVATMDVAGRVTAVRAGDFLVLARYAGVSNAYVMHITPP